MESVHGSFNGNPPHPASLNLEQRDVFDRVLNHYLQGREGQLLLHVDGVTGTGKSSVIDIISKHLAYHAAQRQQRNPVMRGAPTGVAAHTIHDCTLHRLLSLPVKKNFEELNEERVSRLQDQFRQCWLLIIDEKSMIGAQILHQIDRRLRQIRCNHDDFFGGLKILFYGDFGQLPPVAAHALYNTLSTNKEDVMAGLRAYAAIDQTVVLTQIMRQQGNSPEAIQFRNMLEELRQGPISPPSWQSLVRRTKDDLSTAEWESFHDALRLYATNREVDSYNLEHLKSLNRPVMNVKAVNTGPAAKQAAQDEAGNLENELLRSVGAKVMLLWNLCIDEGLANGTKATVHSII